MAEKFVKMIKDGETIEVHPSVVEDHKRLGWKLAEEVKAPTEEETKAEAKKKKAEAEAIVEAKGKK